MSDNSNNRKDTYTLTTLAQIYGMSFKTLNNQIAAFEGDFEKAGTPIISHGRKTISRVLNAKQLQLIVDRLGEPPNYSFNGKKFVKEKED